MKKHFSSEHPRPRLIRNYFMLMMAAWTVLIIGIIGWGYRNEHINMIEIARHQAVAYHNRDQSLRLWAASKGGVYVPSGGFAARNSGQPASIEKEIETSSGLSLMLMSPAAMIKQMRELNNGLYRDQSRVTSLQPLRKENAPDSWERNALVNFTGGAEEAFEVNENAINPYVRLMKPLYITEVCCECHGYEKSQLGQVGGGITVTVPLEELAAQTHSHSMNWSLNLVFIWVLGMLGLGLTGRNISEHLRENRKINERLAQKEEESASRMALFEAMFNSITPDAAVFLDPERRIIMANQVFYDRTGYTADELSGRTCELFYIEPELFLEMSTLYDDADPNVFHTPYEMEYRMKDGSVVQTETMASIVKRPDGELLGCLAIIRDISERKKTEEEIRLALERTRAAEIAANAGSWSWNVINGDLKWSENLCNLYGIQCSEFDGKVESILSFIHPDDRRKVMEDINALLTEKTPRELSYRIVTPAGIEKYIMSDTNLIIGRNGEIEKIIGMMRDVTEKKKFEREKELNQERLSILLKLNEMFDSSTEEIVHFGLDECIKLTGSKSGYFQFIHLDELFNQADSDLFRWSGNFLSQCASREEFMAFLENTGIWPENIRSEKPVIQNDYRQALPAGEYPREDFQLIRYMIVPICDRESLLANVWVANKTEAYDETDVRQVTLLVRGIFNLIQRKKDQMKKRELEFQLQRACKMEAMGALAGGIAHDFNNILAIIFVSAEVALKNIPPDNAARAKLERIIKASDRAKDIVQQILAFSRQAEQQMIKTSPEILIRDSLKLLKSTTPSTVELIEDISCEYGMIEVDPSQFHQVIMNLFTNAVHAMDEQGTLKVSAKVVQVEDHRVFPHGNLLPGSYFKLSVEDDGIGMDGLTIDRIFDPFFTTKKIGEGTGMGLSIVSGIVSSNNGVIDVESKPGAGAAFHVYFPLVDFEEKQDMQKLELDRETGGRILLVDDEEVLAEVTGEMLKIEGYRIYVETDSTSALELFRSNPEGYDLVITDHTMPKMTGLELARELKEIRPAVPIILLTGFNKKISRERALENGISELLYKPYDRRDLLMTIATVMNKNREVISAEYAGQR